MLKVLLSALIVAGASCASPQKLPKTQSTRKSVEACNIICSFNLDSVTKILLANSDTLSSNKN